MGNLFVPCKSETPLLFRTLFIKLKLWGKTVTYPFGMGPDRGGLRGCQSELTPLIHGLWPASFSPAPMLTVTFAPIGEYLPVPYGEATYFVCRIPLPSTPPGIRVSTCFSPTFLPPGGGRLSLRDSCQVTHIAVFGAGPVGLLAAFSAFLRGTLRVYVVNSVSERLGITEFLGTVPIHFVNRDAVEETLRHEPNGVACSADCVGIEAVNVTIHLDQGIVLRTTIIVAATGGVLVPYGSRPMSTSV
jgi:hypothetical protein